MPQPDDMRVVLTFRVGRDKEERTRDVAPHKEGRSTNYDERMKNRACRPRTICSAPGDHRSKMLI